MVSSSKTLSIISSLHYQHYLNRLIIKKGLPELKWYLKNGPSLNNNVNNVDNVDNVNQNSPLSFKDEFFGNSNFTLLFKDVQIRCKSFRCYLRMAVLTFSNFRCHLRKCHIFPMSFKNMTKKFRCYLSMTYLRNIFHYRKYPAYHTVLCKGLLCNWLQMLIMFSDTTSNGCP